MTPKILLGPFSQLVTMRGLPIKGALKDEQLDVIHEGGILIDGERIYSVGSFNELRKKADQIVEINYPAVALPGLIDCHTHMVWGGSRAGDYALRMRGESYEKILDSGGGIFDSVSKTRQSSKDELKSAFINRANRHVRSGVTTFEVKSGYGLSLESEVKMLEVVNECRDQISADILTTCLAAHVCPKEFTDKSKYLDHVHADLLPVLKARGLATRVDAFVEPSAFPVEIAKPYLQKAKNMGFDITVHADQFTTGGSTLAVELGARSADHLEASTDKEISVLARSSTVAVALPGASIGLGMQFTPARKLLNAAAALAISTDWNPGSAPMGDLLTQAAILGIYEKLSTAEVFAGITYRAATALGLKDRGILSEGQLADLIAFPTSDYREILYAQGQLNPNSVWKKGKRIV